MNWEGSFQKTSSASTLEGLCILCDIEKAVNFPFKHRRRPEQPDHGKTNIGLERLSLFFQFQSTLKMQMLAI